MVREPLDGQAAIEVGHQQPEHLRVVGVAQHVHLDFLVAVGLVEPRAHGRGPRRPVGRVLVVEGLDAIVEQFVEQDRMPDEVIGGPAARRKQPHHAVERGGELVQQRDVSAAPGDHVDQLGEAREELVRADVVRGARAARAFGGGTQSCAEQLLDPGARRRLGDLHPTRCQHAAQPLRRGRRIAKAGEFEMIYQRVVRSARIVRPVRERQRRGMCRRFDEHRVERSGNVLAHAVVPLQQRLRTGFTHQSRHPCARAWVRRQRMRLGIVDILQRVLEVAQELIAGSEPRGSVLRQRT